MWNPWAKKRSEPVTDLEERVQKLERSNKQIKGEWEDTFERLMRADAKLAKREKKLASMETSVEDAPRSTIVATESLGDPRALKAREDGQLLRQWRQARGA